MHAPVSIVGSFPSRNGAFLQSRRLPVRATARRLISLRIPLCGVGEYASTEILVFLDLTEKSLVSASGTKLFPSRLLDGNWLKHNTLRQDLDNAWNTG